MRTIQRWAQTAWQSGDSDTGITRQDLAVAAVVALVQVVGTFGASQGQRDRDPVDALAILLLLAGPAALIVRRRYPVASLAGIASIALLFMLLGYPYGPVFLSTIVATVTAVAAGHRRAAWTVIWVFYVSHIGLHTLLGGHLTWTGALGVAAWMLVILIGAEVVRGATVRSREAALVRLEEERRHASEERLRIARELHDVLAHHISLINVQASVALHLMDRRPEQARIALTAIEGASHEAMGELRSVLEILHRPDEAAPRAPAPSLSRLDTLQSQAAVAGLDIRIEVNGEATPLGAAVEAAAYRVIQEAVTNVIRHASAKVAVVRLGYGERALTIEVDDDGAGAAYPALSDGEPGGSGLAGMRARVRAMGGEFEAGGLPGRGFRVSASLPLGDAT